MNYINFISIYVWILWVRLNNTYRSTLSLQWFKNIKYPLTQIFSKYCSSPVGLLKTLSTYYFGNCDSAVGEQQKPMRPIQDSLPTTDIQIVAFFFVFIYVNVNIKSKFFKLKTLYSILSKSNSARNCFFLSNDLSLILINKIICILNAALKSTNVEILYLTCVLY